MRWLQMLMGVEREDLHRVWPLSLSYGLVMAALYVLKPVRNALFLDRFGVQELPTVMLMVAGVGAVTAGAYGVLARSIRIDRLVLGMFIGLIVCLVGFRVLLPLGTAATFYGFYVWVALYGLVATSLLWQLANMRFNPREARRLFGAIGTGGISGAIVGGALTGVLADPIGTENLILVAAAMLLGAFLCLRSQAQAPGTAGFRADGPKAAGALSAIRSSRLLWFMAVTVALIGVIAVIVDVQFNDVVDRRFPTKNQKAAFFGQFFAYFNIAAIGIQLLLTTRVLTSLGVGWALVVLPVALSVGSLGLVMAPGLAAAGLLKMADGSLRHSIHKSAFEILFIPVPPTLKKQTKLFLDATVDSAATGVGALLVMVCLREFDFSYVGLSAVSAPLLMGLFACAWGLRSAYIDTLRQELMNRELDPSELAVNISEAGVMDALLTALDPRGSPRRNAYVLDMLRAASDARIPDRVLPLVHHKSADLRVRALRVLAEQHLQPQAVAQVADLRDDPVHDVRVEAMRVCAFKGTSEPVGTLRAGLTSDRSSLRSAALGVIADYGTADERALVTPQLIDDLLATEGEEGERARVHVATVLGGVRRPDLYHYWDRLRSDPSERVVREAIRSAGKTAHPMHLDWLFGLLADRRYRMDARLALACYGDAIVDELDERLGSPDVPDRMWRVLPRILARIDSQRSVEVLLRRARTADWGRRRALIEALVKLRTRFEGLRFESDAVNALLLDELHSCEFYQAVTSLLPASHDRDPAMALLANTLRQRTDEAQGRAFSLLGLRHPSRDIASARRALAGGKRDEVASALEFLDNILTRSEKEALFPLVDPEHARSRSATDLTPVSGQPMPATLPEAARAIMGRPDAWLRACTLYAMKGADAAELAQLVTLASADGDPVVRETGEALAQRVA